MIDPNEINDEPLTEILQNEMLIGEVQKREALWNFKIPVTERGRSIVQKLWEEVNVCYEWYVSQAQSYFFT